MPVGLCSVGEVMTVRSKVRDGRVFWDCRGSRVIDLGGSLRRNRDEGRFGPARRRRIDVLTGCRLP